MRAASTSCVPAGSRTSSAPGTRTTLLADEGEWFATLADVFDLELPDVDAAERRALWERVRAQHDAWAAQRDG